MTILNSNSNLSKRVPGIHKPRYTSKAEFWQVIDLLETVFLRREPDPEKELSRRALREAARIRVDNLLR
ncbi:hypothetical protein [Silicimonas sp. MF1-12-2]|uniref:hypothetical protein n=1 Tax=Silicimonas sp. MF1-12-2 TaxID=3384793 RepID=UPI0039B4F430